MLFDFDLVVPAHTLASAPVVAKARLAYGMLTEIRLMFPPGPATLVYVVVRDRLHQIMPANADGSINFDDAVVVSRLEYDILDSPFELDLIGWSPTAVYKHTITCQFEMQPRSSDTWRTFIDDLFAAQPASRPRH